MEKGNKTTERYYIVFTASKHKNWMVKMQKAPFQHVYAVKKSLGRRFWIVINPMASHTSVKMYSIDEFPTIRSMVDDNDVVIPVKAHIKEKDRWTLCIFNCVEVVKSLLGIRNFWLFTPHQLYKHLKGAS